tara:strand:+ start:179 stop:1000 length:822 start_codon:yes stop_codon:yes gene_type:complete
MALQRSTAVDPKLGALNLDPIMQANAIEQQSLVNLNQSILSSVQNYQKKQEDKKQKEITINALRGFAPGLTEDMYNAAANDETVKKSLFDYGIQQQENQNLKDRIDQGPTVFNEPIDIGTPETPILRNIVGLIDPVTGKIQSSEIIDPNENMGNFDSLALYDTVDIKDDSGRVVTYVKLGENKVIEFNAPVPEKKKVEEAVKVANDFMKRYPDTKSSEEELVSKLLRLSGGENTFEFNLGQLIGGDGPQVGDIVSQNGIRYEVLEDGSYRQID